MSQHYQMLIRFYWPCVLTNDPDCGSQRCQNIPKPQKFPYLQNILHDFFRKFFNTTISFHTATAKPAKEMHSKLYFYSECNKPKNSNSRIPNSMKPHSTIQPTFQNYFRNSFRHFSTPHRSPVYPSSIISNSLCFKVL